MVIFGSVTTHASFFFFNVYLFLTEKERERERERESEHEWQRGREREAQKAPGSELAAQNLMQGLNSQTVRS